MVFSYRGKDYIDIIHAVLLGVACFLSGILVGLGIFHYVLVR